MPADAWLPATCQRCGRDLYTQTPHGVIGAAYRAPDGYCYCDTACATRSAARAHTAAVASLNAEAPDPPKRTERPASRSSRRTRPHA